uniref:Mediator of RNA polymerase II transcription subunit 26 n=1 Tax=Panagrolaimus sp. ES5 TaxID=591445 RepID=A0AC34G545_9BILA
MEIEISPIAAKLEKMSSGELSMDDAPELIAALEKAEISADVLSKTRIGLILNDFRKKTSDDKLAKRAKQLIKNWKSKVEAAASAKPARVDSESRKKSSTTAPPMEFPEAKRPKLEINDNKPKPNPDLRENVIVGSVSPAKFAAMSADEMASSDMKKLR